MKYKAQGTVHEVKPVETVGQKGFQKRTFVIQTEGGQWPKYLAVELHKEAVENAPAQGDEITVEMYIESREWQGKWFTSAKCANWTGKEEHKRPAAKPTNPPEVLDANGDQSLPF